MHNIYHRDMKYPNPINKNLFLLSIKELEQTKPNITIEEISLILKIDKKTVISFVSLLKTN